MVLGECAICCLEQGMVTEEKHLSLIRVCALAFVVMVKLDMVPGTASSSRLGSVTVLIISCAVTLCGNRKSQSCPASKHISANCKLFF